MRVRLCGCHDVRNKKQATDEDIDKQSDCRADSNRESFEIKIARTCRCCDVRTNFLVDKDVEWIG